MYKLFNPEFCRDIAEKELGKVMLKNIKSADYDFSDIVITTSVKALNEIYNIINEQDCYSNDFDIIEAILKVFEKYGMNTGSCHDF